MLSLLALLLAVEPAAPQVTLPLEEYTRLRQLDERPSLTVVDLVRLEGSFARRDLSAVFTGRATGRLPTTEVLAAEGVRLHSCKGEALLTRGEGGLFALTPSAPRFEVRCKLALDGSDRVEGRTTAAVLEITGAVEDGEWVSAAADDAGARQFTVVRRLAGRPDEDLPPSVTARYRLTLLPDETRFVHALELRNPSRRHRRFEVTLGSGERVEVVQARVAWDREGDTYRFELPPGDTAVTLEGRLGGARFVPPVEASLQYLLVESHPLVLPELKTGAKRVGVGETGVSPRYRGAQAFLLDGAGELTWTARRLEALKTAGIAIDALAQVWFLGADGRARGEASISIDNQGASAFTLPTSAEPTFASLDGEPTFLTRDAEQRLFLPLGQGRQAVLVQDVRPFSSRLGFASLALELPRAGVPASTVTVELRYPREWVPIYEALPPGVRLGALSLRPVALALFVGLLLERLLSLLAVPGRRRAALGAALALGAVLAPVLAGWAAATLLLLLAAWVVAGWVRALRPGLRGLALAGAAGLAGLVLLVAVGPLERGARPAQYEEVASQNTMVMRKAPAAPPPTAAPAEQGAQDWSGAAEGYRGVPARIELPRGERQTWFRRELMDTAAPPTLHVVAVSALLVTWLQALALLPLAALAFVRRRDLAEASRAYAARLRPPEAPPAPTAS